MDYVKLGRTNLISSRIGFGAMGVGSPDWRPWVLDEEAAEPLIERAIELGITLFDTSNFYSGGASERLLGKVLRKNLAREDYILTTKVGNQMGKSPTSSGYSRKNILSAIDASLERLGVEYIDIYQTHIWRTDTEPEELLEAFETVVESGKVRYIGATDMPVWQFARLHYEAKRLGYRGFQSMQHHYNLAWREHESELMPMCQAEGIALLPYSPLARGFFSGDPRGHDRSTTRGDDDQFSRKWFGRESDQIILHDLLAVAQDRGSTAPAVALSWVMRKSGTGVPLLGATSVDQLNVVDEAMSMNLADDEIERLEAHYSARLSYGH